MRVSRSFLPLLLVLMAVTHLGGAGSGLQRVWASAAVNNAQDLAGQATMLRGKAGEEQEKAKKLQEPTDQAGESTTITDPNTNQTISVKEAKERIGKHLEQAKMFEQSASTLEGLAESIRSGGGSGGGSGESGGGAPMMPPPSSSPPEKKDSQQPEPPAPAPPPPAQPNASEKNPPAPDQTVGTSELMKAIEGYSKASDPSTGRDTPGASSQKVDDLVETITAQSHSEVAAIVEGAQGTVDARTALPSQQTAHTTPLGDVAARIAGPGGQMGGLGMGWSGAPATGAPAGESASRVASVGSPTAPQQTRRRAMAPHGAMIESASAAGDTADGSTPAVPDFAALFGGGASASVAPVSGGGPATVSLHGAAPRAFASEPAVNPHAPLLPGALSAVMKQNAWVAGTPAPKPRNLAGGQR